MQVLKLGGSAITRKDGYMRADSAGISRLCRAVAQVWKRGAKDIMLVHGAGSFGHALVIKHGIGNGVRTPAQKAACALTHASCAKLSALVVDELLRNGVPAVSLPPCSLVVSKNRRIKKFGTAPVFSLLLRGYMPVLYGDMVPDERLGFSVCSGDQIAARLGRRARRMVLATDVDGILADGRLVKKISRKNFAQIRGHIGKSGAPDVTGGMAGKIEELMKSGRPAYVVSAHHPERMQALLLGKKAVCTEIKP